MATSAHDQTSTRLRFSVPAADVAVLEWCDAQDNLSYSLRTVIREYIERHGFVDATCHPVSQQPRRGRPPASGSDGAAGAAEDADAAVDDTDMSASARVVRPSVDVSAAQVSSDLVGRDQQAVSTESAVSTSAGVNSMPIDMEDMFSAR